MCAVNVKKGAVKNGSVTVKKGDKNKEYVIDQLTIRAPNRNKKEIEDLLMAQKVAEFIQNPNRVNLFNMFEIALMDAHLTGIIGKRLRAVRNKQIMLVKDGKEVEGTDMKIRSKQFRRLRKYIFNSQMWGLTGLEFAPQDLTYKPIPRKHIKPHLGIISLDEYGNTGFDYTQMPNIWIMQTDEEDNNFGLLIKAVAWTIYKRCNIGDFAQFIELFGQPIRVGKYDAGDIQTRKILEEMINDAGAALGAVIPKVADIEYIDVKPVNGDGRLYKTMTDMCDEQLSILILGQTETTKSSQSSGYAQSEIHAEQQLEITKDDMDYELEWLNDPFFMNILKGWGWPVDGAEFVHKEQADPKALMDKFKLDDVLSQKVPQDDDYWYETYNFPKPKNYEALKAEKEANQQQPPPKDKKPPKGKKNKQGNDPEGDNADAEDLLDTTAMQDLIKAGRKILKSLSGFFGEAPKLSGHSMTNLERLYATRCPDCGGVQLPSLADAGANAMDSIIQDIAQQLYNQKLKDGSIPYDLYSKTAERLMSGVLDGLGGSSFGFDDTRNQLKGYLEHNIYAFSAAKSLTELKEFRSLMTDAEGKVRSAVEFRNACADAGKLFNQTYLETERVTAIATAQTAALWDAFSEEEAIEISTAGDERVRPSHAILDGFTALKSDPVWRRLCPPFDWNCRCTLVPGVRANISKVDKGQLIKDANIPKYFQRNPGITRVVFDEDHPYYINSYGKETEMSAEAVYGMPSAEHLYAMNDFPKPKEFTGKEAANAWWQDQAGSLKGTFDAKDYGGMTIRFDNTFRKHVFEANQESRFLHVSNTQDIIRSPDEVWSQKEKGIVKRFYLKYYDDYPYVVRVDGDTAYTMHNFEKDGKLNDTSLKRLRRGVLVYRKN